jgi:hypothetical protein
MRVFLVKKAKTKSAANRKCRAGSQSHLMISRRTMLALLGLAPAIAVTPVAVDKAPVQVPIDIDIAIETEVDFATDNLLVKGSERYSVTYPMLLDDRLCFADPRTAELLPA